MNNEQKLESILNQYRQWLADEQVKLASVTSDLQAANERIAGLQDELEGYVQKED